RHIARHGDLLALRRDQRDRRCCNRRRPGDRFLSRQLFCHGVRDRWSEFEAAGKRRRSAADEGELMSEPHEMTAAELSAAYEAKTLSPVDVTEALLGRIEALDAQVNA